MTEKYFINLNKKISGNLLCIGVNNKKIIDKLLSNENLTRCVLIDVNLGGTGSGKSWGVASIIQNIFRGKTTVPYNASLFVFDTYGEYQNAFLGIEKYNPNIELSQ